MQTRDWREVPRDVVAGLFEEERARWMAALGWDMTPTLAILEEARSRGTVPGLVAFERGRPAGWTFFLPHDGALQIGALTGTSTAVVRHLLDSILEAPEASTTQSISGFVHPSSAAVGSAFTRRRFEVARQLYLSRDLTDLEWLAAPMPAAEGVTCDGWRAEDGAACVRVLARCYAGSRAGRLFAPANRVDQWVHYLRQLLTTPACGVALPAASRMLRAGSPKEPVGFVLTTSVAPATAHIAQLVVDPAWRGRRLAERLVRAACQAALGAGHERITLIVDEDNAAACALYRRLGFTYASEFVFASRAMPTRKRLRAA